MVRSAEGTPVAYVLPLRLTSTRISLPTEELAVPGKPKSWQHLGTSAFLGQALEPSLRDAAKQILQLLAQLGLPPRGGVNRKIAACTQGGNHAVCTSTELLIRSGRGILLGRADAWDVPLPDVKHHATAGHLDRRRSTPGMRQGEGTAAPELEEQRQGLGVLLQFMKQWKPSKCP
ncbi:Choline/ethanolaminephosphotransferase 1 [Manis javanica]|nr:Choline/ethanolaminephosphotransferase 1 [Manis javanica]